MYAGLAGMARGGNCVMSRIPSVETMGTCPKCGTLLDITVELVPDKVIYRGVCPEHGAFSRKRAPSRYVGVGEKDILLTVGIQGQHRSSPHKPPAMELPAGNSGDFFLRQDLVPAFVKKSPKSTNLQHGLPRTGLNRFKKAGKSYIKAPGSRADADKSYFSGLICQNAMAFSSGIDACHRHGAHFPAL